MTTIRDGYELLNDPLLNKGTAFSNTSRVDRTDNSYVFPGIGPAAVATRARRISDGCS